MKTTYNKQAIVSIKLISDYTVPFCRIDYTHKVGWPWNRKIVPSVSDYPDYVELNAFFADVNHKDYCYYPNDVKVYYNPYVKITFNNGEPSIKHFEDIEHANVFYCELQEYLENNKLEIID